MSAFLARCATCMLAIHEPALACPNCKSSRLVLVAGAWPERPRRAASIPLPPRPIAIDDASLARRSAESAARKRARRERQRHAQVANQIALEMRTFREDRRAPRKAREREAAAARRIERARKKADDRRAAVIARQARLETRTFMADKRWRALEVGRLRRRAERERTAAATACGRLTAGSTVALDSAHGTVLREVVKDLGDAVAITRPEEAAAAKCEGREPLMVGFKKTDVVPSIEARPGTLFAELMEGFGAEVPELLGESGGRLAVPLPEFTAWLAAGGGR